MSDEKGGAGTRNGEARWLIGTRIHLDRRPRKGTITNSDLLYITEQNRGFGKFSVQSNNKHTKR